VTALPLYLLPNDFAKVVFSSFLGTEPIVPAPVDECEQSVEESWQGNPRQ
jgi:hypothetical protein